MIHGSLFAGIGGFDLGFSKAGIKTIWAVEKENYCQKVLSKRFPEIEIFKDIHDVGKHNLRTVDIISGGFPCQPYSIAGERRGKEDDRDLWGEMFRVIKELHPTWVVAENVANFANMELARTLLDLESEGYTNREGEIAIDPVIIPAAGVEAWHRRDRLWIIAYDATKGIMWWYWTQTDVDRPIW